MNNLAALSKMDNEAAKKFFDEAKRLIEQGASEDALRHFLSTNLPSMFPSHPQWIYNHARLAQGNIKSRDNGGLKSGFVDVLLGTTAIEYKKNLASPRIFAEGKEQVRKYCAGLLNKGVASEDIIGVLSDTVRWYSYDVEIVSEPTAHELYGPDNIKLIDFDKLDMSVVNEDSLRHFSKFILFAFDRLGILLLTPEALADAFGLSSPRSERFRVAIDEYVRSAISGNQRYARLIQSLWENFVTGLGTGQGVNVDFVEDYSREFYIVTLAKLICANVITGNARADRDAVEDVITGRFYQNLGIENFVEYDYFGWLNNGPCVGKLVEIALSMQEELLAYSYKAISAEDLFGPLLAELASVDRRTLLGQAPTPQWLASEMVEEMLSNRTVESPRLIDMCCGSGVFIVEVLKQTIESLGKPEHLSKEQADILTTCITGIDVDPLAVVLSKANWLLVMRDYLDDLPAGTRIPVYHADSLFASTPVTVAGDSLSGDAYSILLDDKPLTLPAFLFEPDRWQFTRSLIDRCDNMVKAMAEYDGAFCDDAATAVIEATMNEYQIDLDERERSDTERAITELGETLYYLRVNGQNGIWPFVLGNGFIPAFMCGQFDGVISNPPWLTMSKHANNPYSTTLRKKAKELGIAPKGSAFLHTELATVFFVGAANRYLKDDGHIACILPHSILKGEHGEAFRKKGYCDADNKTQLSLNAIWIPPKETFSNKSAVIFANKGVGAESSNSEVVPGRVYKDEHTYDIKPFRLLVTARGHSTYTDDPSDLAGFGDAVPFRQGFDAFPRKLHCYKFTKQGNGKWTVRSITQEDEEYYSIKLARKALHFKVQEKKNIEDEYVRDLLTSNNVLSHYHSKPLRIFLPLKNDSGIPRFLSKVEQALLATGATSSLIDDMLSYKDDNGTMCFDGPHGYEKKINIRDKLKNQFVCDKPWLVVYGAGGENIAAAAMSAIDPTTNKRLLVDQTLYWLGCDTKDEALFYEGMLNSDELNRKIKVFQPEGNQGKRHIHTLLLDFLPHYDPQNQKHKELASAVENLDKAISSLVAADQTIGEIANPALAHGQLPHRRSKFSDRISKLPEYSRVAALCGELY